MHASCRSLDRIPKVNDLLFLLIKCINKEGNISYIAKGVREQAEAYHQGDTKITLIYFLTRLDVGMEKKKQSCYYSNIPALML
jgi:hypothetical protein